MRKYGRVDTNQTSIVKGLRKLGYRVDITAAVGNGFPDLVVTGYRHSTFKSEVLLVEVKQKGARLTDAEQRFHNEYPADGPLIVANSLYDVLEWYGAM